MAESCPLCGKTFIHIYVCYTDSQVVLDIRSRRVDLRLMYMSGIEKRSRTLGLNEVQANALFAWQHGLVYELGDDTLNALSSVLEKAREMEMSYSELGQVPIDMGWIDYRLLKSAEAVEKKRKAS